MKWLAVLLLLSTIGLVFSPGLDGQFQFDDENNIVFNQALHISKLSKQNLTSAVLSGNSSVLKRPISMASFAINHYFTGLNPFYFKLTNISIHAINALALFYLAYLLMGGHLNPAHQQAPATTKQNTGYFFAFLVALVWGVHPINLTPALYIVQRMTSISAFFVITGLIIYIFARQSAIGKHYLKSSIQLLAVILCGVLALLAKENGALLFLFIFLIEIILHRGEIFKQRQILLSTFIFLTLFLPGLILLTYTTIHPKWILDSYSVTNFSLPERLMTEGRILWSYLYWITLPNNQSLGLFHDDIALSTSLFKPWSTCFALIGHVSLILSLIYLWLKNKCPLFIFGIGLFYASHLIESTVLPLELAHEHRNYLGSFGIILGFVSLAPLLKNIKNFVFIFAVLYLLFLIAITVQRADGWGKGLESALFELGNHPTSFSANYEVARQYILISEAGEHNLEDQAKNYFTKASLYNLDRADALFGLVMISARQNSPPEPQVLRELNKRLAEGPFYASHATWLNILVKCFKNNTCLFTQTEMTSILQSAINNPNLANAGLTRAVALTATSDYVANVGNNYDNALELSILAAESAPRHPQFIKNIIALAIAFKDTNTAETWLNKLNDLNYLNIYASDIAYYKHKLKNSKQDNN